MRTKEYKELTQKRQKTTSDKVTTAYYHPDGDGVL